MVRIVSKRRRLTPLLTSLILGALALVIVAILELTNTTHWLHKRKAVSGTIPSTTKTTAAVVNNKPASVNSGQSSSQTASSGDKSQLEGQQSASSGLVAPYGTFVSNHHPNLSGSPAPSQEQSVCQTTPGATCYIKFTSGDVVKKLQAQTTDQNGTVIWQWDVKQAGLTEGTWQITAASSLNGNSESTTDQLALEVGP